ncbi:MAG: long-chain fatty acid--CoA ligase [Rhodospirillaceae bacterium]|nr:long-chain fatty acid--CoA ligase [Rhodospirillaceae bacterium]
MFFEIAVQGDNSAFLWAKNNGPYQSLSWRETAQRVRNMAKGLSELGVAAGDRIVIASENRPEWVIADLAIMTLGAISVPAYTTNTVRDHRHILSDCGAKGAIVSTRALAARLLPAAAEVAATEFIITMEATAAGAFDIALYEWSAVMATGETSTHDLEPALQAQTRGDTACLIYTSGTGGNPKGVMLSHAAVMSNCMGARELLRQLGLGDEVFLSFLPLSHAYEHTAGLYFPISIKAQIYFAESVETLSANLVEVRPTIMVSVPRLYEVMHRRITLGLKRQSKIKQHLFAKAVALGRKHYENPGSLGLVQGALNRVLEGVVRDKVRARFGGRLKAMVSGGAPLNFEVGVFFTALGVRLLQGYGQTEAAPVISCNPPNLVKLHTVGPPFEGVEVKIAEDGEILARGELVMNGYWNDDASTRGVLKDGWLHTGDIGNVDADGYIQITDRKKDIIVLSGGDNLSPQRVEGTLTLQPEIGQAMVYGDKHAHVVALLVPDEDFVREWQSDSEGDDDGFMKAIAAAVERANADLSPTERVKRHMLAEPFTVNNEQMTPTMKVRRHKVLEIYRDGLEALY